jgi:hypothetical protein
MKNKVVYKMALNVHVGVIVMFLCCSLLKPFQI